MFEDVLKDLPPVPRDEGQILYACRVATDDSKIHDQPHAYAVFELPATPDCDYGGVITYGYYPSRGKWLANPSDRSLVKHLLDQLAAVAGEREEFRNDWEKAVRRAQELEQWMADINAAAAGDTPESQYLKKIASRALNPEAK